MISVNKRNGTREQLLQGPDFQRILLIPHITGNTAGGGGVRAACGGGVAGGGIAIPDRAGFHFAHDAAYHAGFHGDGGIGAGGNGALVDAFGDLDGLAGINHLTGDAANGCIIARAGDGTAVFTLADVALGSTDNAAQEQIRICGGGIGSDITMIFAVGDAGKGDGNDAANGRIGAGGVDRTVVFAVIHRVGGADDATDIHIIPIGINDVGIVGAMLYIVSVACHTAGAAGISIAKKNMC